MDLLLKLLIFFMLEFYLTIHGLDDIADYGEFTDERKHYRVLGVGKTIVFLKRKLGVQLDVYFDDAYLYRSSQWKKN